MRGNVWAAVLQNRESNVRHFVLSNPTPPPPPKKKKMQRKQSKKKETNVLRKRKQRIEMQLL